MAILPAERRLEIIGQIHVRPTVGADELVEHFGVSVETIRRDRIELERAGQTRRVCGGAARDLACSGSHAETFLSGFHGGKAFLGSGGVHPSIGLTDYYPGEISTRRITLEHADQSYLMADSSKLCPIAAAKVCELDQRTEIITADGGDDGTARALEAADARLLVAAVDPRLDHDFGSR
jgi:DeoR/GlpR family transcriptional regulator of sugar metabolism